VPSSSLLPQEVRRRSVSSADILRKWYIKKDFVNG